MTFYQHLKDTKPGQLEIIFISWDGDEDSYKEYYNSMPWLSLPFDSDLKVCIRNQISSNLIGRLLISSNLIGCVLLT